MIQSLYRASQAGVKIRSAGARNLLPSSGCAGLSDNIEVYSIVGRFLEHSRVYCFETAATRKCTSAVPTDAAQHRSPG